MRRNEYNTLRVYCTRWTAYHKENSCSAMRRQSLFYGEPGYRNWRARFRTWFCAKSVRIALETPS